jgi:hypothetical protein
MSDLTAVLEKVRLEYNVAYDPFYSEAILRVIEILKDRELDEKWTIEIADISFKNRTQGD